MDERLLYTIDQIRHLYETKQCSPVEILELTLAHLEHWEPHLNAFISVFAEEARRQAKEAENLFQSGQVAPPLAGIPVSVKDLVMSRGQRTTCASRILRDHVPGVDAAVYSRLKAAGGIVVGKTNLLEFAYGAVHPDYGQTNNPYDAARTSGGSSGGSSASIAAGIGFGSVGTDTGGSIRIPASYCGVVGLKPTYGLVPAEGVFPLSRSLDHVGPIARTASDAARMLDVLAGGDARLDAATKPIRTAANLPDTFLKYTRLDVKEAYFAALHALQSIGVTCVELSHDELAKWESAEEILMNILLPQAAHVHRAWWNQGEDYAPVTYQQISEGRMYAAVDYLAAMDARRNYQVTVNAWFEKYDIILTPTVDFPAPLEDPAIGDQTMNEVRYTGPLNVSGHPALTVNCGVSRDGLPIGLQMVGRMYSDKSLLHLAQQFEQTQPQRRVPEIPRLREANR